MLRDEFLRSIPKTELHCHIEGSVRAATFADQAKKHGISLPTAEVDKLYDYETIYEFLVIFGLVSSTLQSTRTTSPVSPTRRWRTATASAHLRYREMFFNPTLHTTAGGADEDDRRRPGRGARGGRGRLRGAAAGSSPTSTARTIPRSPCRWSRSSSSYRRPELIGLGMDAAEAPDPPENFVDCLPGRQGAVACA